MTPINRDQVQRMVNDGHAILVEVLDKKYFNKFHLPGAINVPLSGDFDRQIQSAVSDKSEPVIVYCQDEDCDASPKAAKRMEKLGYTRVYDYEAGKVDWKEAGLPISQ